MTDKSWEDMSFDELYNYVNRPENRGRPLPGSEPRARGNGGRKTPALLWTDMGGWRQGQSPAQEWTVLDRIPVRQVCLFSGHGAAGKSTIGLHLTAAHALGRDWLGSLPELGPSWFLDAEDDEAVIYRRLDAILAYYGNVDFPDLIAGGLRVMSLAGKDPILATGGPGGVIRPTPLLQALVQEAAAVRPKQIVIASAANVYTGSEIDRSQVNQFIQLLTGLAIASGGSVILISHPSLTGMNTDTGLSGSTQWHNAVRARMYLKRLNENGEDTSSPLRKLEFVKNQYGLDAAPLTLEWRDGMFLPVAAPTDFERAAAIEKAKEHVREALASGGNFSASRFARNYLVTVVFRNLPAGDKTTRQDLEMVKEQMLRDGEAAVEPYGPKSDGTSRIVASRPTSRPPSRPTPDPP